MALCEAALNKFQIIHNHSASVYVANVNKNLVVIQLILLAMCEILRICGCVKKSIGVCFFPRLIWRLKKVVVAGESFNTFESFSVEREKRVLENRFGKPPKNFRFNENVHKIIHKYFPSIYLATRYLFFPVWYLPPNVIEFKDLAPFRLLH